MNTVKTSSGIIFQTNISSFNLTSKPEKAFKEPVKVYVSFEKNKDRCLCKDEDISSKIKNATTNSFEFVDNRKNILETGDDLICNGENVKVSKAEVSGDTIKVTIDKTLSSTISSVVIPNRSEEQELEKREYDSTNDKIISTYKAITKAEKPGRAIKFRVDGVKDTEVDEVAIDLWTAQTT